MPFSLLTQRKYDFRQRMDLSTSEKFLSHADVKYSWKIFCTLYLTYVEFYLLTYMTFAYDKRKMNIENSISIFVIAEFFKSARFLSRCCIWWMLNFKLSCSKIHLFRAHKFVKYKDIFKICKGNIYNRIIAIANKIAIFDINIPLRK